MFRKSFLVTRVCVLCVLVAVMIVVGGCGTMKPIPTAMISPTPLPMSTPTSTTESISTEIVLFLYQQDIVKEYSPRVIARTEDRRIVQVWEYASSPKEIPPSSWLGSGVEPSMSGDRFCFGDWSINTTVRFEIQSPTEVVVRLCKSSAYSLLCYRLRLAKEFNRWLVASKETEVSTRFDCPPPTPRLNLTPTPTRISTPTLAK